MAYWTNIHLLVVVVGSAVLCPNFLLAESRVIIINVNIVELHARVTKQNLTEIMFELLLHCTEFLLKISGLFELLKLKMYERPYFVVKPQIDHIQPFGICE